MDEIEDDPRDLERKYRAGEPNSLLSMTDQTTTSALPLGLETCERSCKSALLLGDPRKQSESVPTNFGNSTVVRAAGTWSSGCRRNRN